METFPIDSVHLDEQKDWEEKLDVNIEHWMINPRKRLMRRNLWDIFTMGHFMSVE